MSMLLCDGLEKRICKRLTGQWNVVRIVGPVLPPLVFAVWAEPGLANEGPVEDLARMVYIVSDARLDQDRRRWVTSYAEQVTVGPAVRGRNRFVPDRVTIEWRQR